MGIPASGQIRLGNDFADHYSTDYYANSGNVSSVATAQRNLGAWHSRACTGFQEGNNLRLGAAHGCASMNGAQGLRPLFYSAPYYYSQSPREDAMAERWTPEGLYSADYNNSANVSNTTGQYNVTVYNIGYQDFYGSTAAGVDAYCRQPDGNLNFISNGNLYFQYYANTPAYGGDTYTMTLRMYRNGTMYSNDYADYFSITPTAYNQWVTVNHTISNFRYDLYQRGVFSVQAVTNNYSNTGQGRNQTISIRKLKLTRNQ